MEPVNARLQILRAFRRRTRPRPDTRASRRRRESVLGVFPCLVVLLIASLCLFGRSLAQQETVRARGRQASEYDVKAAFLLNFVRFVEWPPPSVPNATNTFDICVLGDDPFWDRLNQLVENESVNGQPIRVQHIWVVQDSCRVIFVTSSERDPFRTLRRIRRGVLTVGERAGFLADGGMINFVIEEQRVRFDVNVQAAESAGLRISSRLLNVARLVKR